MPVMLTGRHRLADHRQVADCHRLAGATPTADLSPFGALRTFLSFEVI